MFCGICRKGVETGEGIPESRIVEDRQKEERKVATLWWTGIGSVYATLLVFSFIAVKISHMT